MLSRVAERVYWMARYLERAEDIARLVNVYGALLLDLPRGSVGWQDVRTVLSGDGAQGSATGRRTDREILTELLVAPENSASLLATIAAARENARTTRDLLPTEAWRSVNELHLYSGRHLRQAISQRHRGEVLESVVSQIQRITGLLYGTMSHGAAQQFLRVGRHLERADMTTRVVDVAAATLLTGRAELVVLDNTLWMAVLRSVSAYQMYRQHVRRRVQGPDVLRFLLKDEYFPRSVLHCVARVHESCGLLPNSRPPQELAEGLVATITASTVERLSHADVHALVDKLQLELAALDHRITSTWFRPAPSAPAQWVPTSGALQS